MSLEKSPKILLVEDDPSLGMLIKDFLGMENFDVVLAKDGIEGFSTYVSGRFDLCILDVMMPLMDGFTLAKKIRKKNNEVPIIFLTAKSLKEDKLNGFDLGGDDYITKPFDEDEFIRRINAVLKRSYKAPEAADCQCELGKFKFDHSNLELSMEGVVSRITKKEADVLILLCNSRNSLVKREEILVKVWGENDYFMGRSLDVFITKLRKHLKPDPSIKIENVHGVGFILSDGTK
ncbi:response regulator transcription factor [Ancylomarina sp. 16SWW S1-10-2]|uniref:response regulator transcription factor n=1 Tax=Ancylomarina sp. 16SWW S1-10-2 TaxID=2499681 RepID=UPI0012AD8283|nr:response regulator transcription factor [Ancylomarina sp. 16SWW S1-10-2]MRT94560.1 response regulator transcription factor [Ancylomarina sp. 16SWW S1-10-2]